MLRFTTNKLVWLVCSFCLLLVFITWSRVFMEVTEDHEQAVAAAVQRNCNLVASLEQHAVITIRNADAVLQLVKREYEEYGRNIDFNALFSRGVIDTKYFNGVAVIDENGDLLASNVHFTGDTLPVFSDKKYFLYHKTHKDELYISMPLISPTNGRQVVVVSRRMNKRDGSFGGTVAVQVEPSAFTLFYSNANLRVRDIMSLIDTGGVTYARRTGKYESCGENIIKSPLFTHVAKKPVGNYFAKDAIRGVPTYFSYRKLSGYPMIATVGSAESDVLSEFYEHSAEAYLFGAIITGLVLLFGILLCTVLIYRKRNAVKIKQSEWRYRSIFEHSHDGIIVLKPDGLIETMNNAARSMFKLRAHDVTQHVFSDIFLKSTPPQRFTRDEEGAMPAKSEVEFTRLDGTAFIGEIVFSDYRDEGGDDHIIVLIRDISLRKQLQERLIAEQKRYQRKLTRQIINAQEREREKIGYELHDNVNQILTTVKLYLEMAISTPDMSGKLLPKSVEHVMNCITEIRNLSRELSATTLGTQSLIDSMKALIETVQFSGKINIRFNYDNYHTTLEKEQKQSLYRILQEQLTNIIRHAQATEVVVILSQEGGVTELQIHDNGRGFDVDARRNGVGLNNISSRAKAFGGDMKIVSARGQGCRLQVWLPVSATNEVGCAASVY
jgi:PAS domain S-box-containing protein